MLLRHIIGSVWFGHTGKLCLSPRASSLLDVRFWAPGVEWRSSMPPWEGVNGAWSKHVQQIIKSVNICMSIYICGRRSVPACVCPCVCVHGHVEAVYWCYCYWRRCASGPGRAGAAGLMNWSAGHHPAPSREEEEASSSGQQRTMRRRRCPRPRRTNQWGGATSPCGPRVSLTLSSYPYIKKLWSVMCDNLWCVICGDWR